MKTYVRLTRVPYEEPYHLHLRMEASRGRQCAALEFYDKAASLLEAAEALETFPRHKEDEFLWELGSELTKDQFSRHFYFRVFLLDSLGHSAIHIRFNNSEPLPVREIAEFCIPADPADINRLGSLFREFAKLENTTLEWDLRDGELR